MRKRDRLAEQAHAGFTLDYVEVPRPSPKPDEERQETCAAGEITQLSIVLTCMLKTYLHVNLVMQMAIKLSPLFAAFRTVPAVEGKERTERQRRRRACWTQSTCTLRTSTRAPPSTACEAYHAKDTTRKSTRQSTAG